MFRTFVKYVGCGNDFIIFDNRDLSFLIPKKKLIQHLCHRQYGIGADGIILLEKSQKYDFRMRIFNADGSEAEMCGNGIRCLVKYCHELFPAKKNFTIESMHKIHKTSVEEGEICIDMCISSDIKHTQILFDEQQYDFNFINTGVPHAVYFNQKIDEVQLEKLGPYVRHHSAWGPSGSNVTLVQMINEKRCKIRTFERGVEGETFGCGTGATAAAIIAAQLHQLNGPLTVEMKGGSLKIGFDRKDGFFSNLTMTGPAVCTFKGKVHITDDR